MIVNYIIVFLQISFAINLIYKSLYVKIFKTQHIDRVEIEILYRSDRRRVALQI